MLCLWAQYQNFYGFFILFSIDLENGLTVRIRGYKKNDRQMLDGSFSLFTSEGEPVQITYTADNENDTLDKRTKPKVPKYKEENSTIEDEDEATTTEFFDN